MPKTAKYALVSAASSEELQRLVNKKLANRWQQYGCPFQEAGQVCQAMILTAAVEKRTRKTSDD